jgi:hypothetical protein
VLERTRRTIKRALRHVPPDAYERGQPRWKLPRIIQALESSGAPMTRHGRNGPDEVQALIDELQDMLFLFDDRCDHLQKLPLQDRFAADKEKIYAGRMIGAVERKLKEIHELVGPPDIAGKYLTDEMLFKMIDRITELCGIQLDLDPEEVEVIQAEHQARVAKYEQMRAESRVRRRKTANRVE